MELGQAGSPSRAQCCCGNTPCDVQDFQHCLTPWPAGYPSILEAQPKLLPLGQPVLLAYSCHRETQSSESRSSNADTNKTAVFTSGLSKSPRYLPALASPAGIEWQGSGAQLWRQIHLHNQSLGVHHPNFFDGILS